MTDFFYDSKKNIQNKIKLNGISLGGEQCFDKALLWFQKEHIARVDVTVRKGFLVAITCLDGENRREYISDFPVKQGAFASATIDFYNEWKTLEPAHSFLGECNACADFSHRCIVDGNRTKHT